MQVSWIDDCFFVLIPPCQSLLFFPVCSSNVMVCPLLDLSRNGEAVQLTEDHKPLLEKGMTSSLSPG